jgi:serine/threonine protein kinase
MSQQVAVSSSDERDPVEQLAEEFLDCRRHGHEVTVGEYAKRYPQLAERIYDLFPTLLLVEEFKPGSISYHSGGAGTLSRHGGKIERLGDFRILREIGRGGMGVVYEAEQESLGRHVALKVLPAASVASPNRLARFLREAQAAARLHHTNIVPIFGVGQQDGLRYYVMQLILGQGLDQVLSTLSQAPSSNRTVACGERNQTQVWKRTSAAFSAAEAAQRLRVVSPTPDPVAPASAAAEPTAAAAGEAPDDYRYWRSVARIGLQVADALEYAHRQGTLHRDIKPANLLLDERGTVWVADFGLAKLADHEDLTHSGDMVGTLRYMAPEQFSGKADARSDVYSLGLTLYELLTLRPAFGEKDRRSLIRQVTQEEPARPRKLNPAVPLDLETIVVKAIACHPEHRYQSAGELAADLKCYLEDRPIRARRTTLAGRLWRWCRRNRAVAALTGTALSLLLAVAVVASVGYLRTNQALARVSIEREHAETERARTKAERERAEANLRLATKAFEDIFGKVAAADPVTRPPNPDDDPDTAEPAWETVVTDKDAALLESMLKFYDQFAQQNEADVKLQEETARAYQRVGEIQRRLGQYEKAETAYRRALATYQRLGETSAERGDYRTSIAAVDNDLGVLLHDTGRLPEAHAAHQQALDVLRQESPQTAALAESQFELAQSYSYLSRTLGGHMPPRGRGPGEGHTMGGGHHATGGWHGPRPSERDEEAAENNRQALAILGKLTEQFPDNSRYRLAMARSQRDRYMILSHEGQKEEAGQARQEAIAILKKLDADAPHNPDYRYELAEIYAVCHGRRPDEPPSGGTLEELRSAVQIGSDLVARYPTVPEYRASLARSHQRLAEVAQGADSHAVDALATAEEHLAKAVALEKSLAVEFPTVPSYRFFLIRSLHQLAETQIAEHQPARARVNLEEAIAAAEKSPDAPSQPPLWRRMLPVQYTELAGVLRELGENSLADAAAARAGAAGGHFHSHGFGAFHHEPAPPVAPASAQ